MPELKDFPKNLIQIATICQSYNMSKGYVSFILPSSRTSIDIGQINEVIKQLCHKDNFVFMDHQNITSNDFWVDDIYLENSEKAIIARDFAEKANEFLCQNSNFQRSFIWQISRFYK